MPFFPTAGSTRLRAIQICQLSVVLLTILATLLAAVIPQKHKGFTFGLLYSLILTSITTTFLVRKEQIRAANGTLGKDKYVKYQLFKIIAAAGLYVVGFVAFLASSGGNDTRKPGEQGLWIGGVKVNKWQGMILWIHFFNWVFLWASLFYSCCMTSQTQGAIALAGEEAQIGLDPETENDEAIARNLQAEDPNWRA
ncbi:Nn.00g107860.m01.CDS01 [Neocucurbitaria sp. VM-36]